MTATAEPNSDEIDDQETEETKRCRRCGNMRPLSLFKEDARKPDGLSTWCIPCAETFAELRRQNPLRGGGRKPKSQEKQVVTRQPRVASRDIVEHLVTEPPAEHRHATFAVASPERLAVVFSRFTAEERAELLLSMLDLALQDREPR